MAIGVLSRFIIITTLSAIPGCFFSQPWDPTRPCSSAANRTTTIERFGLPPAALTRRSASIPGAKPDPSSMPPVAPLKQSKWPPITMYSSGYCDPRIVATTLWYLTGPILNQLRMSNSSSTGWFFSTIALISSYCVSINLMSGSTGSFSHDAA
jgi:hypothetical protein